MYCRNCGKQVPDDARFCMYCGTPVEIPAETIEEPETAAEAVPETAYAEHEQYEQPDTLFGVEEADAPEPEAEPEPIKRERPVFDEINWNVNEYPDTEKVTKTDDIDFNWNARPEDIPDPVVRRDYRKEPDPVTDFFTETGAAEAEAEAKAAIDTQHVIEPVDDIDIKLQSVIKGEEPEPAASLFAEKPETEELSAAQRIDKFYTFNRKNEEFQQLLNREYEKVRSGNAIGEELSKAGALADEKYEARDVHEPQTMEELFEAEGIEKPYQPKAFESDVLQRIEAQEAEREIKRREDEKRRAEMEKARKAAEEARIKAEAEEARIKAEREAEEARIRAQKAAEEARFKEEEDARLAAEEAKAIAEREAKEAQEAYEEARIQAEKEAKAREEEAARREAAEAKIRAEEEARRVAEEEARIKAEAVAKYQAQEEARIRAEEELKAAQEAAKIKAQQEARAAAEEQAKYEAAKEARRLEEVEAKRRLEEEQKRLTREANESIAAEEARKVLEQTARMRDEEAAKIRAAVAGLRASTRAAIPDSRKDVAEAHRATRDQINEMAKARQTFFGDIDLADEIKTAQEQAPEPEVQSPQPEFAAPEVEIKEPEFVAAEPDFTDEHLVTGRETMLGSGSNLADTRVFDKSEILAGISDATIAANRADFADMTPGLDGTKISRKPEGVIYDTVDDLLNELEATDVPKVEKEVTDSDFDLENLDLADMDQMPPADDLYQTMEVPQPEEVLPPEETPEVQEEAEDFTSPEAGFIPQEVEVAQDVYTETPIDETLPEEIVPQEISGNVEEPTMIFSERSESAADAPEDLSGTRRFDEGFPVGSDNTDHTIVVGQSPQSFADLPSNDFDDYGNEEAREFIRKQEEEAAFNTVAEAEPKEDENVSILGAAADGAAAAGAAALTKKEKKAAEKEARKAAKEAAREAKKAKKSAKSAVEEVEDAVEEEEKKGGKGRTILIILLVLLCIILAAEVVGIGVHWLAPQSKAAEIVDNQLNKVIHLITGEEETEYSVFAEERRVGPRDDYAEVVTEKADRNYNGLIEKVTYNKDLAYDDQQVADISDLVLSMPITEFEWGRTSDNLSVYYDEEVIGQAIAYESQKYALLKSGDESVLSMISRKSTKKSLLEKKNSDPAPFTELEIGEVRVSGSYYYVWVREHIGDETKARVIKMFPEKQFDMMVERGYDV